MRIRLALLAATVAPLLWPLAAHGQASSPVLVNGVSAGWALYAAPAEQGRSLRGLAEIPKVSRYVQQFEARNLARIGSVKPEALTAAEARARLERLYHGQAGSAFLSNARASRYARSGSGLAEAAIAFFAKGQAAAALGCLVTDAQAHPTDAGATLNLAAGALAVGLANEALGLLSGLPAGTANLPAGPWGMPGALYADYLRGYALTLRGEVDRAYPLVKAAFEAAPQLSEAGRTLALLEARKGLDPRATLLKSTMRFPGRLVVHNQPTETERDVDTIMDPLKEGEAVGPDLSERYDLSLGRHADLPPFTRPRTPAELRSIGPGYVQAWQERYDEAIATHTQANETMGEWERSPSVRAQDRDYFATLFGAVFSPYDSIRKLDQASRQLAYRQGAFAQQLPVMADQVSSAEADIVTHCDFSNHKPACLAQLDALYQSWLNRTRPAFDRYIDAIEQQHDLHSAAVYGMLAHVGVPAVRSALLAQARALRLDAEVARLNAVGEYVGAFHYLFEESAGSGAAATGADGEGPACQDDHGNRSLGLNLVVASLSFNCTSVTAELEMPVIEPYVSISGEVTLTTKGEVTGYIGPKGKVEAAGMGGSVKGGVYITAGSDGFIDAGVKTTASISVGVDGFANVSQTVGEASVSLVPGP